MPDTDSTDLRIAKRLLDHTRRNGVQYRRVAPGPDGPLLGTRECPEWKDTIYLAGFGQGCFAIRERRSSLLLGHGAVVEQRVEGNALTVLNTVLTWPCGRWA